MPPFFTTFCNRILVRPMRYLYLIFAVTLGLSHVGCSAQRGEYVVEGNGRLRKLSDKEALIATFKSKVHMTAYYEKRGDRPIRAGAPSGAPPRRWPRCSCSLSYFNSSRLIRGTLRSGQPVLRYGAHRVAARDFDPITRGGARVREGGGTRWSKKSEALLWKVKSHQR